MLGGSGLLVALGALCLATTARAAVLGRWPGVLSVAGTEVVVAYAGLLRRWMRGWGTDADELDKALPDDELVPRPSLQNTRAVTINAPPDEVWRWLAQIGQDRGGF